MRILLISCLSLGLTATAVAQSHSISELAPVAGLSFYSIDGTSLSGPSIALQYTPNRYWIPALEFSGGVVLRFSDSKTPAIPSPSTVGGMASFPTPLPQGGELLSSPPPARTALSFGYGFIGTDVKIFLADGSVRPYLSAGVQLVMYSWYAPLTVALAPDVRGGIDLKLSNDFTGFAEVRYAVGLQGALAPARGAFEGATMLALGFTFLPSFN